MTNANRFVFFSFTAIEAQIKELQTKRKEITTEAEAQKGVGLLESGNYFDSELYETSGSKSSKYEGYVTSIAPNDDGDDDDDVGGIPVQSSNGGPKRAFNPVAHAMKEIVQVRRARDFNRLAFINPIPSLLQSEPDYDPFADHRRPTIGEKEDEYRQKRRRLVISPERVDPFADGTFVNRLL